MRVSDVGRQNWKQIEIRRGKIEGFSGLLKKEMLKCHSNSGPGYPMLDTEAVRKMNDMGMIFWYIDESKLEEMKRLGHFIEIKDTPVINGNDWEHYLEYPHPDIPCLDESKLEEMKRLGLFMEIKNTPDINRNDWEYFCEYPNPDIYYPMHVTEFARPLKFDPSRLTDEIKTQLNKKYRLDRIKPDSKEYYALMKDLQEKGILSSGRIYNLPPSVTEITTDEKGNIRSIRMKFPGENSKDAEDFLIYTRSLLAFGAKNYEALAGKENRTSGEQAVVSIYESHQNIMAAIEQVFSEQLA